MTAMTPFTVHTGVAAPLRILNIDTDLIIPKLFLKTIKRTGLGKNLFDEVRYLENGQENPDFVLNKPEWRQTSVLIAGDNFGCGSSREHAPWALMDFGIRAIISTSFADIFYNNCFKNGILPIVVSQAQVDILMADADQASSLTVDLPSNTITRPNGEKITFEVDAFRKHCMLNGLDDIALTLEKEQLISAYEAKRKEVTPWL